MTDEQAKMLVETNTMVKMIYDQLPKLASCEGLDAVRDKAEHAYNKAIEVHGEVVDHVRDHESLRVNRNLIVGSYLAGFGALFTAIVAMLRK